MANGNLTAHYSSCTLLLYNNTARLSSGMLRLLNTTVQPSAATLWLLNYTLRSNSKHNPNYKPNHRDRFDIVISKNCYITARYFSSL